MNGDIGGLRARARILRDAAAETRGRALRLGAQVDAMHWEGAAARRLRSELGADLVELSRLAVASEHAAEVLEAHAVRLDGAFGVRAAA